MEESELLRIYLLGRFRVEIGDQPVPDAAWRRRRPKSLLQILALSTGFRLHREQIFATLWPDLGPEAAGNNLNVTVYELRRLLEGNPRASGRRVERIGETVALVPPESVWVDAVTFEAATSEAWRAAEPAMFWRAVDLYSGDLLPDDPYEEWIEQRRISLRASYLTALARLAVIHEHRGNDDAAIAALKRLLDTDPLDEQATRNLMAYFARSGQRSRALSQYHLLVQALERELGLEPEPATSELFRLLHEESTEQLIFPVPRPSNQTSELPGAATGRRSNLPAEVSSLIGREREVAELVHHLSTSRLVTLTGPGGVGKTALALAVAREVSERFAYLFYVPLEKVRESDFVLAAIAQGLHLHQMPGQSTADGLVAYLADKRALLVLDNFEHVIDAGRDIASLLTRCPHLKILVTSRIRLRLQGEHEYPVLPLTIPEQSEPSDTLHRFPAVELFDVRVRQVRPQFEDTLQQVHVIAEICRRLDGLPLAIELAAARCKMMTPKSLLARLERRLAMLTGGSRDLPERQQTIRDTIAWSYDLLNAHEQRSLRQFSVFIGGWDLESAEAVHVAPEDGASPDVLDLVFSLVDQNLVVVDQRSGGESRFRMLETIREFGLEQLGSSADEALVRERHARYFAELVSAAVTSLYGPEQVAWLDRLEQEHANILAALDWFLDNDFDYGLRLVGPLWHLWWTRGYLSIGRHYYDTFLSRVDESEVDTILFAYVLAGTGIITEWQGDSERARRLQEKAMGIWLDLEEPPEGSYWSFLSLGNLSLNVGDLITAENWYQQGLEFSKRHGHGYGVQVMRDSLAIIARLQGRHEEAEKMLREALASARERGDTWSIGEATRYLGMVLLALGRYDEAGSYLDQGLEHARQLGNSLYTAESLRSLGVLELQFERLEQAEELLRESLAVAMHASDSLSIAWTKQGLGAIARRRNDLDDAERLYRESIAASRDALERSAIPGAFEGLATIYVDRGDDGLQAVRLFAFAASCRERFGVALTAPDHAEIDQPLQKLRSSIQRDVFELAWSDGQGKTFEQICEQLESFGAGAAPIRPMNPTHESGIGLADDCAQHGE